MEQLTKKEEEIMQAFWDLKSATVRQVIEKLPEPHPPHSTVSSVARILAKKEFLGHRVYGKTFEYFPVISIEEYREFSFKKMFKCYFGNSYKRLASFISNEELSEEEIQELKEVINQIPDQKKE